MLRRTPCLFPLCARCLHCSLPRSLPNRLPQPVLHMANPCNLLPAPGPPLQAHGAVQRAAHHHAHVQPNQQDGVHPRGRAAVLPGTPVPLHVVAALCSPARARSLVWDPLPASLTLSLLEQLQLDGMVRIWSQQGSLNTAALLPSESAFPPGGAWCHQPWTIVASTAGPRHLCIRLPPARC